MFFSAGFETGDTSEFTTASGVVQGTVTAFGSYAGINNSNSSFTKTLSIEYPTLYMGGFFRWSTDFGDLWYVMVGAGAASDQFLLRTTTDKKLSIRILSTSTEYESSSTFDKDTWHNIEIKYITHDTAGAFEVRVNGITEMSATGIDTKKLTDTGLQTIAWQGIETGGNCFVDHVYADPSGWRSDYGVKISRDGYDVLTAEDPRDLVFSSEYSTVKIAQQGSGQIVVSGSGTAGATISHNLGFVPMGMVYLENTPSSGRWYFGSGYYPSEAVGVHIENTNPSTSLLGTSDFTFVAVNDATASQTANYYYYIFADNG